MTHDLVSGTALRGINTCKQNEGPKIEFNLLKYYKLCCVLAAAAEPCVPALAGRFHDDRASPSGTPASRLARRMTSVVLTLATLGAAVRSSSTKSWKRGRSGATHFRI